MIKKEYTTFLLFFLLIGCNKNMSIDMNKELLNTDQAFSLLCKEKGMNFAFLYYVAEEGVMLRANNLPIVGKNKIKDLFQGDDSEIEFSWDPLYADVAKSGELGYTYGTYEIYNGESVQKGTYISVWKKDTNGEWKFVLDSGNQGLSSK